MKIMHLLNSSEDDVKGEREVKTKGEMNCKEGNGLQGEEGDTINVDEIFLNIFDDDEDAGLDEEAVIHDHDNNDRSLQAEPDIPEMPESLRITSDSFCEPTNFENELKKIIEAFPIWNFDKSDPKFLNQTEEQALLAENTNLKETLTEKSRLFINEIKKVLYSDHAGHPPKESLEYFKAAERYAFYGKKFHEFPEDYSTLYDSKNFYIIVPESPNLGDGLYPTPLMPSTVLPNSFGVQLFSPQNAYSSSKFGGTTYFHPLNLQQNLRQGVLASAPSPFAMHRGNNLGYVPTPTTPQHIVYNKLATNAATNFISNSLANAALTASPALLYSNPLLASKTQQYLSNFIKQAPYAGNPIVTTPPGSVDFYERLAYAQALQKQILQYQARATATAVLQQKQQQQHFYHHYNRQQRNQSRNNNTNNNIPLNNNNSNNIINNNNNSSNIPFNNNGNGNGNCNGNGNPNIVGINNCNSGLGLHPANMNQNGNVAQINHNDGGSNMLLHNSLSDTVNNNDLHNGIQQNPCHNNFVANHNHNLNINMNMNMNHTNIQINNKSNINISNNNNNSNSNNNSNNSSIHINKKIAGATLNASQSTIHILTHKHQQNHPPLPPPPPPPPTSSQNTADDCTKNLTNVSSVSNISSSINPWRVKRTPSTSSVPKSNSRNAGGCDLIHISDASNAENIGDVGVIPSETHPGVLQKPSS